MKTDGSTWMWGDQNQGQLGVGNWTTNYSSPMSVLGSGENKFWTIFSTGGLPATTYALAADGTLWVWGYTGYVLGGTAAPTSVNSPIEVEPYIFDARGAADPYIGQIHKYISAGVFGGLAGSGARVWVWGSNAAGKDGQLCLGDVVNHPSPTLLSGIWIHAAHGESNVMLIDVSGNVYGCGNAGGGRAGFTGSPTYVSVPVAVAGAPHSAIKVAAAQNSQYFGLLREDGSLWMWGENDQGELGVGDTVSRTQPTSVLGSGVSYRFVDFSVGGESGTVAIDDTGQVWGWGQWGHIGDNTTTDKTVPTKTSLNVITPEEFRSSPTQIGDDITGPFFTDIAAGNQHTLALKVDGSAWAWGSNTSGQIGDGTINNAPAPTSVVGSLSFVDIAAGTDYSYALRDSLDIFAWGDNTCGKLGDDTTTDRSSPVAVSPPFCPVYDTFEYPDPIQACWNWEQGPLFSFPGTYSMGWPTKGTLNISSGDAEMWGPNPFDPTWQYQSFEGDFDIETYVEIGINSGAPGSKRRVYLCATGNTVYPPNNDYIWIGYYDQAPGLVNTVAGVANLTTDPSYPIPNYGPEIMKLRMQRRGSTIRTWYQTLGSWSPTSGWVELTGSPQLTISGCCRIGIGAAHWAFSGNYNFLTEWHYFCKVNECEPNALGGSPGNVMLPGGLGRGGGRWVVTPA